MATYAIIKAGVVTNTVTWDGTTKFILQAGETAVDISALKNVGIGSTYDGTNFTAPPVKVPIKTIDDVQLDRIEAVEARVKSIEAILTANNIK